MRALQRAQTWAADRWSIIGHPRLRRIPPRERDWIDKAFKWMVIGWALWWIWGAIILGALVVFLALIG